MAIAKYGGIVTEIRGSIGGTTFRQGASVGTMYNKSSGASKSKNALQTNIRETGNFIADWVDKTPAERTAWNTEASNFTRVNRFGQTLNYTGRQLYIAHRWAIKNTTISEQNPALINQNFTTTSVNVNQMVAKGIFEIKIPAPIHRQYVAIQIQGLRNESSPLLEKRYKTLSKFEQDSSVTTYVVGDWSKSKFYEMGGKWVAVWISLISEKGWRNKPIAQKFQITT